MSKPLRLTHRWRPLPRKPVTLGLSLPSWRQFYLLRERPVGNRARLLSWQLWKYRRPLCYSWFNRTFSRVCAPKTRLPDGAGVPEAPHDDSAGPHGGRISGNRVPAEGTRGVFRLLADKGGTRCMDLDLAVSEGLADRAASAGLGASAGPAASADLGEVPGVRRPRRLRAGVADAAAV